MTGQRAAVATRPEMPTGPVNRVASNLLARQLLCWEPNVPFGEGLCRSREWYRADCDLEQLRRILAGGGLIEHSLAKFRAEE
jgi:hypothetical protein